MREIGRTASAAHDQPTVPHYYRRLRLGYWLAALALSLAVWVKILF